MILVCGIPSEAPVALVLEAASAAGAPVVVFNQRHSLDLSLDLRLDRTGHLGGCLRTVDGPVDLDEIDGVYLRPMDHALLPEVRDLPAGDARRGAVDRLHERLIEWTELAEATVFNRCSAMASNGSKPYQAQLIQAAGFRVPRTLVTNDPAAVRAFHDELGGRVIYKSASGARSIVQCLDADDLARLDAIRWCPTQFQERVDGYDVRVHVAGDEVFATRAVSDAVDYRYAGQQVGSAAELVPHRLEPVWAEACAALAHGLGLGLAGVDLKVTPAGEVVCFEVNPSPGFSYYERSTGQGISAAVVRALAGAFRLPTSPGCGCRTPSPAR